MFRFSCFLPNKKIGKTATPCISAPKPRVSILHMLILPVAEMCWGISVQNLRWRYPMNSRKGSLNWWLIRIITHFLTAIVSSGATVASDLATRTRFCETGYSASSSESLSRKIVTLAAYERVKPGMSLVEVNALLDPGTETESSRTGVKFIWLNPDKSNMTAWFKDGKLELKQQCGLK
jgi:hypothetical protein